MFRLVSVFASSVSREHLGAHSRRPFRSHLIFAPFNYPARSSAGPPSFLEARRTHTHGAERSLIPLFPRTRSVSVHTLGRFVFASRSRHPGPPRTTGPCPGATHIDRPFSDPRPSGPSPELPTTLTNGESSTRCTGEFIGQADQSTLRSAPIASCRKNQRGARNEP